MFTHSITFYLLGSILPDPPRINCHHSRTSPDSDPDWGLPPVNTKHEHWCTALGTQWRLHTCSRLEDNQQFFVITNERLILRTFVAYDCYPP
jgi:hypothetical protein